MYPQAISTLVFIPPQLVYLPEICPVPAKCPFHSSSEFLWCMDYTTPMSIFSINGYCPFCRSRMGSLFGSKPSGHVCFLESFGHVLRLPVLRKESLFHVMASCSVLGFSARVQVLLEIRVQCPSQGQACRKLSIFAVQLILERNWSQHLLPFCIQLHDFRPFI